MATMTMVKALNAGLQRALGADPTVLLAGEDIGNLGGVFRVTEGLKAEFGGDRVIDTPLAESGIVGTCLGMALSGYRPVVEIQFDGFVFPATNQIITQVARQYHRSHGRLNVPMVIRLPYGGGIGAVEHHSESPETYFTHTPGLKVVACATPSDAYWMIQQAIASPDPVVFMEPKRRYHEKGEVDVDAVPMPLHQARVVKQGKDLTVLCWGGMVRPCVEAAIVAADEGKDLEVIDLRTLSPLDDDTILTSVAKTGRAVIVHEAMGTAGLGAEITARIQERCFYALQAPVLRVTGYDMPYPPNRAEVDYLPDLDRVLDAVDRSLAY